MAQRYPTAPQAEQNCDTSELEWCISRIGEIVEVPVNVPSYATCHTSIVATWKEGSAPGEFNSPFGVAIHKETHQIFVTNCDSGSFEIFSETGEFLYQLGVGELFQPYGVATHGDSVYVSCFCDYTVSKYSLTEMCLIRKIGGDGSDNGQFDCPQQLTTDLIGRVFIADCSNHRICVHDPDLNHVRNITHESMSEPYDVKVSHERLYVLCPSNNPCMHVLTLEGDKLHSLITCGEGMDVLRPCFFCLDALSNFVLSDYWSHSICVFSQEGILLHTIGRVGYQSGMSSFLNGVVITPSGRLVCASGDENYALQIFY